MELTVENRQVLLTAHKTYSEVDGLQSLRDFAEYPPLCTYLAECAKSGPIPNAVVVRHLDRVAHRITGAVVDLVYQDACIGRQTEHVLRLTSARPAVLLPILVVKGQRYALLVRQVEASQGFAIVTTAMRGVVNTEGGFASDIYASALEEVGIRVADATPLSSTAFNMGNEGDPPIHLFTLTTSCDEELAEQLNEDPCFALVMLKDVFAAGDAAASLAVSLILATA
ncbi:hypothetical protein, conserved [Leishmania tarentolae]|uniref:Uncharacterized protein n=1 Tax=Leishmania tarentolae TaxID=5689 RepID=A0A640KK94_LEITA|nr:hypothetical protein, conserved [Leishmania tarentolae]